ncbi:hypothetical protein BH20ACT5_BH20ACT5_25410 [soil metagenome]
MRDYDEAVYDVVTAIPPGKVLSYGDIAEYLGSGGARRVAQAMSRSAGAARGDGQLPWHRVVRTDGTPAPHLRIEQLARLRAEGAPVRGDRVDMAAARWDGRD